MYGAVSIADDVSGPDVRHGAVVDVSDDDPRFDCRMMGNEECGGPVVTRHAEDVRITMSDGTVYVVAPGMCVTMLLPDTSDAFCIQEG